MIMKAYETSAKVEDQGRVQIVGVPFAPGTEVQVTISPQRVSAEEFTAAWHRVCAEIRDRSHANNIADEDIIEEIDRYRADQ
jgi:hypothetical protein